MRISSYQQFLTETSAMTSAYNSFSKLMTQVNTGRVLTNDSDNPALSYQINAKADYVNTLSAYSSNGNSATTRATIISNAAQNTSNVVSQVQTLLSQAQNPTSSEQRTSIASALQGYLNNLVSIANTPDENGNYIFSGSSTTTPPYALVNGSYQYQGSDTPQQIDIAPNTPTVYGDVGSNLFGNVKTGNGTFTITAGSNNTGTATTTAGNVTDANAYVADNYTLTFTTNSTGQIVYQVSGATNGQVIPVPPATSPDGDPLYTNGSAIKFNGMSLTVSGQPAAGDTFQIQPSTSGNVFDSLNNLISALNDPSLTSTQLTQKLTQYSAEFETASSQVNSYLAVSGARAQTIQAQVSSNTATINAQTIAASNLGAINPAQVYSALSQQSLVLQATQSAYTQLQSVIAQLLKQG